MFRTCLVTRLILLLLLNLGVLSFHVGFVVGCHEVERQALLKFKESLIHGNDILSSWDGRGCCRWEGVGCDNVTNFVNRLDLLNPSVNTPGTHLLSSFLVAPKLDPSLLELRHLNYLDLSYNDFQGSQIPGFIGSFKYLRHLKLVYSMFSGVVPSQLGNLTRLRTLDLSSNFMLSSDLHWASALVNLQYLNMGGISISRTKNSMNALNMPSLLGLDLSYCQLSIPHILSLFSNSTLLSRIHNLDLSGNLLQGPLPGVLANMTSLRNLYLPSNNFSGSIPLWLRNMRQLEELDLSFNSFTRVEGGTIMGILGNLCTLKEFGLSYNSIRGGLGAQVNFSQCTSYDLETLELNNNMIGGTLPVWLGDFKFLWLLDISRNKLDGPIPVSIGNLSFLEALYLSDNTLNDTIPETLGQCQYLVYLDLSSNFLQGAVSEIHLANLLILDRLDLSFNHLDLALSSHWLPPFQLSALRMTSCNIRTQFPRWIGNQTKLEVLDLSDNFISGELVQWFPSVQLFQVNISHNQITGRIPYFSSSELSTIDLSYNLLTGPFLHDVPYADNDKIGNPVCQLPSLVFLHLQRNKIVGTIPDCWGYMGNITYINLSSNKLSGNIPMSMGLLPELRFLKLSNNSLQGLIPSTLSSSSNLQILDLGENKLVGKIPINWDEKTVPGLEILRLRGNQLVGVIPPTLCSLPKLQFIDLANNRLTGGIPRCFGHLILMDSSPSQDQGDDYAEGPASPPTYADPREDSTMVVLKGAEMQYTTTLKFVVNLDLSCNALVGSIPEEITNLSTLIGLNLSHNHLTGNIPTNIGEMRLLESLDLSNNDLSGTIPSSISTLTYLIVLDLSYNKLHGRIPTGNQLQVIEDPSMAYIGNPGLCGDPLINKCEGSHNENQPTQGQEEPDNENNREKPLFYLVIFSGFATGFWVVVGSLILKRRFRFALFQRVENVTDYLYVQVMIRFNRLRNQ